MCAVPLGGGALLVGAVPDMAQLESELIAQALGPSAKIVEALIDDIQNDRLAVGEPLPTERDLSDRFSVSRPAARQALLVLALKGFATISAERRPRASRPSMEGLIHQATASASDLLNSLESLAYLEQVRLLLELSVVRLVAGNATNAQVFRLYDDLMRGQAAIDDSDTFREADIAFHRTLVGILGNPILEALHQAFLGEMFRRRTPYMSTPENRKQTFQEHTAIFEAVKRGDAEGAAVVMERHLNRSYRAFREMATAVEPSS